MNRPIYEDINVTCLDRRAQESRLRAGIARRIDVARGKQQLADLRAVPAHKACAVIG
jgi:hypothetical protein